MVRTKGRRYPLNALSRDYVRLESGKFKIGNTDFYAPCVLITQANQKLLLSWGNPEEAGFAGIGVTELDPKLSATKFTSETSVDHTQRVLVAIATLLAKQATDRFPYHLGTIYGLWDFLIDEGVDMTGWQESDMFVLTYVGKDH